MALPTQWTWVWVNSGSWWWTGRPGVLQSMGSQSVRHNWVTELNWIELESSVGKGSSCNAGDTSLILGLGRSLGEEKGYPIQCSVLENSMDCIVQLVTKNHTWLNDSHFHLQIHAIPTQEILWLIFLFVIVCDHRSTHIKGNPSLIQLLEDYVVRHFFKRITVRNKGKHLMSLKQSLETRNF